MSKPGRNDPCHCGSGLKYKKCHEPIEKAAEKERLMLLEGARYLRRDFLKFARDQRFAEQFAAALSHYWNGLYTFDNAEEMSESEAFRFIDWFTFDYQPTDDQPRLIEVYRQERWDDLATTQQAVLESWLDAPPAAAYELVDYEGQTLHLRDFVTGEEFEVYEGAGHGETEPGDLILTRLLPMDNRLEFSTTAAYLPQEEIADLADKLASARAADAEAHPGATYQEYMRRHNTILIHHALEQAQLQDRYPVARLDPERKDNATRTAARQLRRLQFKR
jgi:hypothetical protein